MIFYTIIVLSILIPLLSKNKKKGLCISCMLLFFLWGLEYRMCNDWDANEQRWDIANNGLQTYGREIESLYISILKFFKPLTFFGWLMLCGVIELFMIFILTVKFTPQNYYWASVFILMTNFMYGLLMINSNRQTIAMMFTWLALLLLLFPCKKKKNIIVKYVLATINIFIATQIHSGSYLTYIFLFFPFIAYKASKIKTPTLLIIINVLFFFRYFANYSSLMENAISYWSLLDIEGFDEYFESFGNVSKYISILNTIVPLLVVNLIGTYLHKLDKQIQLIGLITVFGLIGEGFVRGNFSRIFVFFSIFQVWVIPNIMNLIHKEKGNYKTIGTMAILYIFSYTTYMFIKGTLIERTFWYRWLDFKTIFEAPQWL